VKWRVKIVDDGGEPSVPLFEQLAEFDRGPGWCWIEGRGWFVREEDSGWWREATAEEIARIRNEP
jgi:hypothetical protein